MKRKYGKRQLILHVCIKIVSMKEQKSNRKLNFWSWNKLRSIVGKSPGQSLSCWGHDRKLSYQCEPPIKTVHLRNSDFPAHIWPYTWFKLSHDIPGDPDVEKYHTNMPKMNEHTGLPHRNPWNFLIINSISQKNIKHKKINNFIKNWLSKVTKHMKNIVSSLLAQTGKS